MSRNSRLAILLGGVVVVVLAFVLLRPSADDEDTAPVAQTATAPAQTAATPSAETTATTETTEAETQTQEAEPAEPEVPTIRVRSDGSVAGGVQELDFESGDEIEFRVESAVDEEVHVHGYDIARDVSAGGTTTFRFDADLEGVFEVEIEGAGKQIAELQVSPS
jgi:FtsP/CotA-like multicopper oxidase with cupredoxin domain